MKYYDPSLKNKRKLILTRIENFIEYHNNFKKLILNKKILKELKKIFGSEVVFDGVGSAQDQKLAYDTANNKFCVFYDRTYGMTGKIGTVSGTSISFGSENTISSANITDTDVVYDASAGKALLVYRDTGNSSYGTLQALGTSFATSNFTSENFIGFTDGAFADGQSALINTTNTIDRNQSGLTAGQTYFVQTDGTLGLTAATPSVTAGTAISATELIVKG